ncbi:hypothetical protein MPTK2_3g13950 [Marchantia polymorpha subsp. ruderalis]
MAALAVGFCQPCALLNAPIRRLSVCKSVSAGRLAWDPLHRRTGFSLSTLSSRREPKLVTSWRASSEDEIEVVEARESVEVSKGFLEKLTESLKDSCSSAVKPALAVFLAGMLLLQPMDDAMAASSGGRMGGRVFKSAPAPSRSYSGGGGGGGGGGRGYAAPPIYGSPYGYGSPFGFSPFNPFFGGGYGYGGGGLLLGPSIGFGGGGFFLFAMIAFVTLRAIAGFLRNRFDDRDDFDD